jgi:hypothetical protein
MLTKRFEQMNENTSSKQTLQWKENERLHHVSFFIDDDYWFLLAIGGRGCARLSSHPNS